VLIQDSVIFAVLVWVPCHDSYVIPKKVSARWLLGARNKTLTINYSESHLPGPQPSVAPPALCLMSRSGAFSAEGVRSVPVSPDPPAARLTKISASSWSCGMPGSGSKSGRGCFVADRSRFFFFFFFQCDVPCPELWNTQARAPQHIYVHINPDRFENRVFV